MARKPLRPTEAVAILRRGHNEVARLVDGLTERETLRPGLGGGEWSAKALLGHLTSWEEHALAAVDAWGARKTAPIDRALRREGLDAVNQAALRSKAAQPHERIREEFEAVHERLLARIGTMAEAAWDAPPTPRSRSSLGERLGSLLVGASGPFGHADSHLADLRAWLEER